MTDVSPEVVVLGAGLAGTTAAYELRDRDVLVLERAARVGGRTLSGSHGQYWFNSGAQFVWDHRTLELCRSLGIQVLDAHRASASLYLRDRLVESPSPYGMMLRLPLSIRERVDLARTITRLRRLAAKARSLDALQLDAGSLADLMGRTSPMTRTLMDLVSETGTGLRAEQVSGWIGLGYAIHLFGGHVNATLKQVVGGTQTLAKALAAAIGEERIMLDSEVLSVENRDGKVAVRYRQGGGAEREVTADACVMALPVDAVLATVAGLPGQKRGALERMAPYGRIVSVAWLTAEREPTPWDRLLVTPVLAQMSFEQISNNAFFIRQTQASRQPGGTLVTLSTGGRAEAIWQLTDDAIRLRQVEELSHIFPAARAVLASAETRIERWHGFPAFRKGWLRDQPALRGPFGQIHFCGDYTAQPGTPGAVGSGHYAAEAVRRILRDWTPAPARALRSPQGAPQAPQA